MPLYFRIGLPGPFAYSKRIGGGRKRPKPAPKTQAEYARESWVDGLLFAVGMFLFVWLPCVFVFGMPWGIPTLVVALAILWDTAKRDAAKRKLR